MNQVFQFSRLVLLLVMMFTISCQEEELTIAQINAEKLKQEITQYKKGGGSIDFVEVYISGRYEHGGSDYSIASDGFISIGVAKFNLGKLVGFQIAGGVVQLYF